MTEYDKQVQKMAALFSTLTEKQRKLLIEGFGEVQGMLTAGMFTEAQQQLQSMKDIMTYPVVGTPPAVFSPRTH